MSQAPSNPFRHWDHGTQTNSPFFCLSWFLSRVKRLFKMFLKSAAYIAEAVSAQHKANYKDSALVLYYSLNVGWGTSVTRPTLVPFNHIARCHCYRPATLPSSSCFNRGMTLKRQLLLSHRGSHSSNLPSFFSQSPRIPSVHGKLVSAPDKGRLKVTKRESFWWFFFTLNSHAVKCVS